MDSWQKEIDKATEQQNRLTLLIAKHQHALGYGVSIENPKGSLLFKTKDFISTFGTVSDPQHG